MSDNEFEVIEARPERSAKRLKKTHDSLTNLPHFEPTKKLEGLPNEILLKVFDNFQINDLINCGQVSKRIRSIAHHEILWQKVNLDCPRDQYLNYKSGPHGYRISAGLIQLIIEIISEDWMSLKIDINNRDTKFAGYPALMLNQMPDG